MSRYIDANKLKEIVNRQYRNCHGYTGIKKDIYREALLAVKSAIHCQSVIINNIMEIQKIKREAKSEAIKEFASRLKYGVPQEYGVISCYDVDDLVKEMVGENK